MKNAYRIRGEVTLIYIKRKGRGLLVALIDTEDFDKASQITHSWYACKCNKSGRYYIYGKVGSEAIALHRYLLDTPKKLVVDHINHNSLDNRRGNIRVLTHAENHQNRMGAAKNSKTGIRGVRLYRSSWVAEVNVHGKDFRKSFTSKRDARLYAENIRRTKMPFSKEAMKANKNRAKTAQI